ncbi:SCP2 sterol-binding domain-containing protein [Rhizobium cremeum]|uniref:ubiquinone anaerobic biosynthesis accessory factor UbiT n=1 Tax=Rhizobium cremeum TaxID=2813827 RepID=UPI000DD935CC|nr:SCP2 sterol-binding domain-containing protein [Rhizobium cremeum]MCJ7996483.1 SCP2 sterol-binding domain-containing protein [Rhizobium cremeum]MCJ8001742.1 SCP2 sterol-binding domain-containing protein [Rhizobium cremeum]
MKFPPTLATPLDLMPLPVIERATGMLFRRMLKEHPNLFERLGEHKAKRFAFLPSDLPLAFIVDPARPSITVKRKSSAPQADASVGGPLFLLLALLEGRCDADALFFSRDLVVTGDMEAMLAMRNALDDCNIDLPRDLSAMAGPLGPIFSRLGNEIRRRALAGENNPWN